MTNSLKLSHLMSPVKDRPSLYGLDPGDFLSENSTLKLKLLWSTITIPTSTYTFLCLSSQINRANLPKQGHPNDRHKGVNNII